MKEFSWAAFYEKFWWTELISAGNHLHVVPSYGTVEVAEEHLAWHDDNQGCLICDITPTVSLCPRNESCFDWRFDGPRESD